MKTYSKHRPTCIDAAGAFLPDRQDWLVVPVSQTRDSGPLDQSNFASALDMLGGESHTVEVHRFGHWGPGWYEIILVDPSDKDRVAIAEDIESRLSDYPILDEMDYSKREHEAFEESWDNWGRSEYSKALCKEDYEDSEGFTGIEIANEVDNFTAEEIDQFAAKASQLVNWHYEPDGDGVSINIKGLVDNTDFDAVISLAVESLRTKQHQAEVKKLGSVLGACPSEQLLAVRQGIKTVSGYCQLMQGMI